ncbi:7-cyano-7-deazaguanine synthase, partial [Patescibacteria group bacterium]|nr:7-cyano-7-deazaguanine synthase [Patescibacteria group bacterium]
TCYNGTNCGKCPACLLRIRGFEEAGVKDPIKYLKD